MIRDNDNVKDNIFINLLNLFKKMQKEKNVALI